jgi:hypothetical protein
MLIPSLLARLTSAFRPRHYLEDQRVALDQSDHWRFCQGGGRQLSPPTAQHRSRYRIPLHAATPLHHAAHAGPKRFLVAEVGGFWCSSSFIGREPFCRRRWR